MTTIQLISDIDAESLHLEEIEVEHDEQPKQRQHYVDNEKLQAAFLAYYHKKQQWLAEGKGVPPLCNVIGAAIMQIARRRTFSRNFIGYTQQWKEEMIGDATETCCRYAHNYNPIKYSNPFAYLTQIISYAIIQRIKLEKKHLYIKYKTFDNAQGFAAMTDEDTTDEVVAEGLKETSDMYAGYLQFIAEYEKSLVKEPNKDSVDNDDDVVTLDAFLHEDNIQ